MTNKLVGTRDADEAGFKPLRPGLPKLIATDLDGTIVRSDNTVSARTRAAFERVRAMGIPIVGVTGRGPRLIDLCRRDLPEADYFVFGQGARVVDLTGSELSEPPTEPLTEPLTEPPTEPLTEPVTLLSEVMAGSLVSEVLANLEAVTGPLSVLVEPLDAPDTNLHGEPNPAWRFADAVVACSRSTALSGQLIKAFAHSDTYTADELLVIAQGLIGPDIVEMTQAGLGYIEICPRGVTKASGLAVVAAHLGVDADDILVFGDMPNDLSMFGYAGWSRVAVANAHPALIAVADEVIGSCDEDGVAAYLERLLDDSAEPPEPVA